MPRFIKLRSLMTWRSLIVILINLCVLSVCWVLVELASFGLIRSGAVTMPAPVRELLVLRFPAQLRMDNADKSAVYGPWAVRGSAKLAIPLSGLIDPEIGDTRPLNIEAYVNGKILRMAWMNAAEADYLQKFWSERDTHTYSKLSEFFAALRSEIGKDTPVLFTFGGSTTAFTVNWPYFFQQEAAKHKRNIAVLNLAQGGWVVQDYTDFYTRWHNILTEGLGRAPDAVLSLSGTNDLTLYAMGYTDFKRGALPFWNPDKTAYAVYGMKTGSERQMSPVFTLLYDMSMRLFEANGLPSFFVDTMPYTAALVKYSNAAAAAKKVQNEIAIPPDAQEKLLNAFETRSRVFHGVLQANGLCHVGYLQPMALNAFYPFNAQRQSILNWYSVAYMPQAAGQGSDTIGGNYIIAPDAFFEKAPLMYRKLNRDFPGRFTDLASLFASQKKDLYSDDSIHYSVEGSTLIAQAIYRDLEKKGVLTNPQRLCRTPF